MMTVPPLDSGRSRSLVGWKCCQEAINRVYLSGWLCVVSLLVQTLIQAADNLCAIYHICWLLAIILFHNFGVQLTRKLKLKRHTYFPVCQCVSLTLSHLFLGKWDSIVPGGAGEADVFEHAGHSSGNPFPGCLYRS